MIFLDTCSLLMNSFEKKSLSHKAVQTIKKSDGCMISSISIWEIGIKVKKGKLGIPMPLDNFVAKLKEVDNFHILAIDETIWMDSLDLDWNHRDPADRIIVASAKAKNMELVTSDKAVLDFYSKAVW